MKTEENVLAVLQCVVAPEPAGHGLQPGAGHCAQVWGELSQDREGWAEDRGHTWEREGREVRKAWQGVNTQIFIFRAQGLRCASSQCIEEDYDKMALPDQEEATEVHTSFELRDVIDIDDEKFTITFSKHSSP